MNRMGEVKKRLMIIKTLLYSLACGLSDVFIDYYSITEVEQ